MLGGSLLEAHVHEVQPSNHQSFQGSLTISDYSIIMESMQKNKRSNGSAEPPAPRKRLHRPSPRLLGPVNGTTQEPGTNIHQTSCLWRRKIVSRNYERPVDTGKLELWLGMAWYHTFGYTILWHTKRFLNQQLPTPFSSIKIFCVMRWSEAMLIYSPLAMDQLKIYLEATVGPMRMYT